MSRFNTDELCLECIMDEKEAPGYPQAAAAERAAVRAGNYNFPGIGLGPEDGTWDRETDTAEKCRFCHRPFTAQRKPLKTFIHKQPDRCSAPACRAAFRKESLAFVRELLAEADEIIDWTRPD
jgi:hypothetical protein